jgi:hypothetical protein
MIQHNSSELATKPQEIPADCEAIPAASLLNNSGVVILMNISQGTPGKSAYVFKNSDIVTSVNTPQGPSVQSTIPIVAATEQDEEFSARHNSIFGETTLPEIIDIQLMITRSLKPLFRIWN